MGQRHDAKYSLPIVEALGDVLEKCPAGPTYDPFAGTGHALGLLGREVTGGELEPEFAAPSSLVKVADALDGSSYPEDLKVIVTSPCYGNRLADQYLGPVCKRCHGQGWDADENTCKSCKGSGHDCRGRFSYAISLGRKVTPGSSAAMPFLPGQRGDRYRTFHSRWLSTCSKVLPSGSRRLVINMSDYFATVAKVERRMYVVSWWIMAARQMGFHLVEQHSIPTRRIGQGANQQKKVDHEAILVFDLE